MRAARKNGQGEACDSGTNYGQRCDGSTTGAIFPSRAETIKTETIETRSPFTQDLNNNILFVTIGE